MGAHLPGQHGGFELGEVFGLGLGLVGAGDGGGAGAGSDAAAETQGCVVEGLLHGAEASGSGGQFGGWWWWWWCGVGQRSGKGLVVA